LRATSQPLTDLCPTVACIPRAKDTDCIVVLRRTQTLLSIFEFQPASPYSA
jgi:hypothetical protein